MPARYKSEYQEEFQPKKAYFPSKKRRAGLETRKIHFESCPVATPQNATQSLEDETDNKNVSRAEERTDPSLRKLHFKSEYQRNFGWKAPQPKESPLIAATHALFGQRRNITGALDADSIPRRSEYRSQFVAPKSKPIRAPPSPTLSEAESEPESESQDSESAPPTPVPKPPVLREPMKAPTLPKPVLSPLESLQDDDYSEKRKRRRYKSTYSSHYKSPTKRVHEKAKKFDNYEHQHPSWFDQVLELRAHARDYEVRSRGTYFSRDHLAQLEADQLNLWDRVSSTLETMSLSSLSTEPEPERPPERKGPRPPPPPPRRSLDNQLFIKRDPHGHPGSPTRDDDVVVEDVEFEQFHQDPLIGCSTLMGPRHSFQSSMVPIVTPSSKRPKSRAVRIRGPLPATPLVDPLIGQEPKASDSRHTFQSPYVPVLPRERNCTCGAAITCSPEPSQVLERAKTRQNFWAT